MVLLIKCRCRTISPPIPFQKCCRCTRTADMSSNVVIVSVTKTTLNFSGFQIAHDIRCWMISFQIFERIEQEIGLCIASRFFLEYFFFFSSASVVSYRPKMFGTYAIPYWSPLNMRWVLILRNNF